MTKDVRFYERNTGSLKNFMPAMHTAGKKDSIAKLKKAADRARDLYKSAVKTKREISDRFVYISEVLADRTAKQGLFGEDIGKGYPGTDVDFLPD